MLQSRILRPYTEKFFRAAGLSPGMRVLDVGSGMGDVALLVADIVGPSGSVLGIDRDPTALEKARKSTLQQLSIIGVIPLGLVFLTLGGLGSFIACASSYSYP